MEKAWGAPAEVARQKDAVRHTYRIDAERVDVYCHQDVVQSLVVQYDQHPAWAVLSGQIGFDKIESVDIRDEFGELMGIALPENGVIIAFDSASKDRRVSQVIYEPVDAQSFALRRAAHGQGLHRLPKRLGNGDLSRSAVCPRLLAASARAKGDGSRRRSDEGPGGRRAAGAEER